MKILICLVLSVAYASAAIGDRAKFRFTGDEADAKTLTAKSEHLEDGFYRHEFDTENGIRQSESGVGGQYAQGVSSYYAPDGRLIQTNYIADENGYRATGAHIPEAPPVPAYILKSLEYIRREDEKRQRAALFGSNRNL